MSETKDSELANARVVDEAAMALLAAAQAFCDWFEESFPTGQSVRRPGIALYSHYKNIVSAVSPARCCGEFPECSHVLSHLSPSPSLGSGSDLPAPPAVARVEGTRND